MKKNKDDRDIEQYRQIYTASNFIMFHYQFLEILEPMEAILLSMLQNKEAMNCAWARNRGWFYCKMTYTMSMLKINRWKHSRLFASLTKKGIIETRRTGAPPRRYLRINYKNLHEQIQKKNPRRKKPSPQSSAEKARPRRCVR